MCSLLAWGLVLGDEDGTDKALQPGYPWPALHSGKGYESAASKPSHSLSLAAVRLSEGTIMQGVHCQTLALRR